MASYVEDITFDDDEDEDFLASLGESSQQLQNVTNICEKRVEELLEGFDADAGKSWIYPTNYEVRDYQFAIVQKGLFSNTLVCLPTGLGKTFIAAVIMYNFYRWYPQGKIIFMAPTKPLVAQQIEACFNIMGIPQAHMIELTGNTNPALRKEEWQNKRLFFLTPQVMSNDLCRGACPAALVKCLVVDEAHKALGNHAYAVVVKEIVKVNRHFRILALSATPGSDIKAVQQIITNLLIANVEMRSEDSLDIMPYTHQRKIEKIVIPLCDQIEGIRKKFLQILGIYVQRLARNNVLSNANPESLSTFWLLKERERFRNNTPGSLPQFEIGKIEGDFAVLMSLYHAFKLLTGHGLRSFYHFLKGTTHGDKKRIFAKELLRNDLFSEMMEELDVQFDASCNRPSTSNAIQPSLDGNFKSPDFVSHPKMKKLIEIVLEHFKKFKEDGIESTRIMIFSQYRDSVEEITEILNKHQPLVKAMSFIGHGNAPTGKGLCQKDQLKVVSSFRNGGYNTLVATCVGEEGLDIGDVDLIICYDVQKSPIRLVQRMGRTGRKRDGRIVMLVTKGKEEQMYNQGQSNKRSIDRTVAKGSQLYDLYELDPRMVPVNFHPVCNKIAIKTETFKTSLMLKQKATIFQKVRKCDSAYMTDGELSNYNAKYKIPVNQVYLPPASSRMHTLESADHKSDTENNLPNRSLSLTDWLPWQNVRQPTILVNHSKKTDSFVNAVQTIQVYSQLEDDNNSYELELRPFLNKEDVAHRSENGPSKIRISDFFPVISKLQSPGRSVVPTPQKREPPSRSVTPRKKRMKPQLPFTSDSDDDFSVTPTRRKSTSRTAVKLKFPDLARTESYFDIIEAPQPVPLDPLEAFFHIPQHLPTQEYLEPLSIAPKIRIMTPPPSPPEDILAFQMWLNSLMSTDEKSDCISPKTINADQYMDACITDDIFTDWKIQELDNATKDLSSHVSPICSPKNNHEDSTPELCEIHPVSPILNSLSHKTEKPSLCNPNETSRFSNHSLYSVSQLVGLLNVDSPGSRGDSFNDQSTNSSSKYRFKRLSRGGSQKNWANSSIDHSKEKYQCFNGTSTKIPDNVPRTPAITNQSKQNDGLKSTFELNKNNLSCNFASRLKSDESRSVENFVNLASSPKDVLHLPKPGAELCSVDNDSDGVEIIPPTPKRPRIIPRLKYKFRSKWKSDDVTPCDLNDACLSPILNSKVNQKSERVLIEKQITSLSTSTPARLPSDLLHSRPTSKLIGSSILDSPESEFISGKRSRNKLLELPLVAKNNSEPELPRKKRAKLCLEKQNLKSEYIDDEAIVSGPDCSSDEDEHVININNFEESFIDDRLNPTQAPGGDTSRMAVYLRSIRSPPSRPGAFKLPSHIIHPTEVQGKPGMDVFSQQPSSDDSDYQRDSFCVENDFVEFTQTQDPATPKKTTTNFKGSINRRRIITLSDSSSSEEDLLAAMRNPSVNTSSEFRQPKRIDPVFAPGPSTSKAVICESPLLSLNVSATSISSNISDTKVKTKVKDEEFTPTILISSMELASGREIISDLRLIHGARIKVVSLDYCDYIVSNHMAVERKSLSDMADRTLRRPLLLRIREMISQFDRSCLIIESDSIKTKEATRKFNRTKYFDNTLISIAQTRRVKILYSQSQKDTASILFDLCRREGRRGSAINVPIDVSTKMENVLNFYTTLPDINYAACLNFCAKLTTVSEFLNSSPKELQEKGSISKARAERLHKYLHHEINITDPTICD